MNTGYGVGCRHRPQSGFTLIEALVGLALLAALSAALAAVVGTASRMTEVAQTQASANQDKRLVVGLIERYLSRAVPLTSVIGGKRLAHFQGDERAVQLVLEEPARFAVGGLFEVVLASARGAGETRVMMTRRLVHPDRITPASGAIRYRQADPDEERVLLEAADIDFGYYGRTTRLGEPRWHSSWKGEWGLPLLVRVRITDASGEWPEIVVRPQIRRARFQTVRRPGRAGARTAPASEAAQSAVETPVDTPVDSAPSGAKRTDRTTR